MKEYLCDVCGKNMGKASYTPIYEGRDKYEGCETLDVEAWRHLCDTCTKKLEDGFLYRNMRIKEAFKQ